MLKLKNKIASGFGSVVEWYDFSIYGFFAPFFPQIFFPNNSEMVGVIKSFTIFAVGFFARPLGALFFGYIADKYGRVVVLKLMPLLITVPTFAIAFLPSYHVIGFLAPVILLGLRVLQGLCIGGEFSNSIVYLCETADIKNRYFLGAIGVCTGSCGILLASIATAFSYTLFSTSYLILYGWRIAFGLSALLGIIAFWLRSDLSESDVFQKMNKKQNPIMFSLKKHKIDYVKSIGLLSFSATTFYFIFMFLPIYATKILGIHMAKAFGDNAISLSSRLLIIPIMAFIADKIGGIILTRVSCILFILLSLPVFFVIIRYPSKFFYCAYSLALLSTLNAASVPGILIGFLNPEARCTIFSFSFNFCFGVFGGAMPAIGFYLINEFQNPLAPVYYLIISSIITLMVSFSIKNSSRHAY